MILISRPQKENLLNMAIYQILCLIIKINISKNFSDKGNMAIFAAR